MIDWRSSMQRSYEFYKVDPHTWKDDTPITTITKCSINEDKSNATLGSATIDAMEVLDECYVRTYLVVNQNGITEKFALGTHLIQTPSVSFDGKVSSISMDAYTPLIELKGSVLPIGYSLLGRPKDGSGKEGQNIMHAAVSICRENMRAPVIATTSDKTLDDDFVSDLEDTCLSFTSDLISLAKYEFELDGLGQVMFAPVQNMAALKPVWIFDDSNSSILYPEITNKRDLYNIPNAVEVVYSSANDCRSVRIVNDDPSSPVSTVNRGWTKTYRESNPNFPGIPTTGMLEEYARELLRSLSSLEHTITFKHGYCPVRVGDCVMLDYKRSGITNTKAKIISRTINCDTECSVSTTAVYTTNLWR